MSTAQLIEKIECLPEHLKKKVEEYVLSIEPQTDPDELQKGGLKLGLAKGKIWMSEDFDEPLEDFKDYM
jgi:hypothetical protein